jgi:ribosome biogenesis protein Nip4
VVEGILCLTGQWVNNFLNYTYLSGGEDIITDEVHQELIKSVERPKAIHIGDIIGEMINSIQVLNEQIRNDS